MKVRAFYSLMILVFCTSASFARDTPGATIPWVTYEAEAMKTTGTVMGPKYTPFQVETESSGQKCVRLDTKGEYVQLTATINANSLVIRYNLPEGKVGGGKQSTLAVYKNGALVRHCELSSQYTMLYGKYPFKNEPGEGKPRNFYDEIRIKDLQVAKGDLIKIQFDNAKEDDAEYCIIDLADLENIAPPLKAPSNSLSIADERFAASVIGSDYTGAFRKCIETAAETRKTVWIPAGVFKITGDIVVPSNITIQGAGMWHSMLIGEAAAYTDANKRVRIKGKGSNIHLADFAIVGRLNYRSDREANDGIVGSFGTNSTISSLWIEHTKVGMWIENSKNLKITGCRMRNTIADGINLCVGMTQSTIENCTTRGTGDDCFAIWPTTFAKQEYAPGHNFITHCTAQLPFLANGAAVYGGESNQVKDCSFSDISAGSAILISTTFPTENQDKTINNNFSGITVIENCDIKKSGGWDHEWDWRGAVEICLDKRNISGIVMNNLRIENSLSNGLRVVAKNEADKIGVLSNTTLNNIKISTSGLGVKGKHAIEIDGNAHGSLTILKSEVAEINNESKSFSIQ